MTDTPNEPKAQEPEGGKTETPKPTETKPEVTPPEETVTIPKKKFEQLEMASNLNSKLQRKLNRINKSGSRGMKPQTPQFTLEEDEEEDEEESRNQQVAQQRAEQVRFQNGLLKEIVEKPQYQKLLSENEILRKVLSSNPLSLLDQDNPPSNADEALEMITDYLDEQLSKQTVIEKVVPQETKKSPEVSNPPDNAIAPAEDKPKKPVKKDDVMSDVSDSIAQGMA